MYIILDKNSVVIGATEQIVYASNGNVGVSETFFYDKSLVGGVVEVAELPVGYIEGKYKYVNGVFEVVEGWKEPTEYLTVDQLQELVKVQEQAITELSMYIATLGI